VIITDLEELSQIDWRVAVIDEAHRLKNRNCKLLQGLTCFELVSIKNIFVWITTVHCGQISLLYLILLNLIEASVCC